MRTALSILALISIAPSAFAGQVYTSISGRWQVEGFVYDGNRRCTISTSYPEGSRISINVYPNVKGEVGVVDMVIKNMEWTFEEFGDEFRLPSEFQKSNANQSLKVDMAGILAEENTVFVEEVPEAFLEALAKSDEMSFFKNTNIEMSASLEGSLQAMLNVEECFNIITGEDE